MWCQLRIPLPLSICGKICRYQIVVFLYMQKQYTTNRSLSQSSRKKLNPSESATMHEDNHQPAVKSSYLCFAVTSFVSDSVNFEFVLNFVVLATSNSTALSRQIHLAGGRILLGEVYQHSKAYSGVLILPDLCGDMAVFVWSYHVLSLPNRVQIWNRNQNLWSRPVIYKAYCQISKHF